MFGRRLTLVACALLALSSLASAATTDPTCKNEPQCAKLGLDCCGIPEGCCQPNALNASSLLWCCSASNQSAPGAASSGSQPRASLPQTPATSAPASRDSTTTNNNNDSPSSPSSPATRTPSAPATTKPSSSSASAASVATVSAVAACVAAVARF